MALHVPAAAFLGMGLTIKMKGHDKLNVELSVLLLSFFFLAVVLIISISAVVETVANPFLRNARSHPQIA